MLIRQLTRSFFRQILGFVKNLSKKFSEDVLVCVVPEVFRQETEQRIMRVRLQQPELQPSPPDHLPFQICYIGYIDLVDEIDWIYRLADMANELVVSGGVLSLKHGPGIKQ